ncbi:hypothetical protein [Acidianus sp. HS-5]|uniref:hypothetical protein n=1 Tax=Acidianus sp. HS-5 TaxID=2886040 RepID=UPI001F1695AF|nr:hypothetical protein [Acidianus sp. HS-5]BDC17727.1 hypothetical protein HS5_06170 [Acidianus sp. HS-5]
MELNGYSLGSFQISTNFLPNFFFSNPFQILVDSEFGNLIVEFHRDVSKSFEGEAFVTIGVDKNGKISYISIEPIEPELKEGIKTIKRK